ncbi:hypothetical protein E2562_005581 [Oryza meyeriana var. granulata]|uniref:Uncharacterized protein n=1 Tax=Oryza meyeriana var. granulata TaxID=110450 RepID=A0A6G1F3Y3_9ORYZ|nr:hypothetical protein E2562_005581 [Oryza meyeriana var. granulata]
MPRQARHSSHHAATRHNSTQRARLHTAPHSTMLRTALRQPPRGAVRRLGVHTCAHVVRRLWALGEDFLAFPYAAQCPRRGRHLHARESRSSRSRVDAARAAIARHLTRRTAPPWSHRARGRRPCRQGPTTPLFTLRVHPVQNAEVESRRRPVSCAHDKSVRRGHPAVTPTSSSPSCATTLPPLPSKQTGPGQTPRPRPPPVLASKLATNTTIAEPFTSATGTLSNAWRTLGAAQPCLATTAAAAPTGRMSP